MEYILLVLVVIALLIYFWKYVLGFLIFVVVVTGLIYAIMRIFFPDWEESSAVEDPIGLVAFNLIDIGLAVSILSLIAVGIYLVVRLIIWLASL